MTTEERLTRLERNNRRLTLALVLTGLAATLMATAGMAGADAVPKQMRAGSFAVVDDNGKERVGLAVTKDGQPYLALQDDNGKNRVGLAVKKDGNPGLVLNDKKGNEGVGLVVTKDGPGLVFRDENGKDLVALGIKKVGQPVLTLFDENGKVLRELP